MEWHAACRAAAPAALATSAAARRAPARMRGAECGRPAAQEPHLAVRQAGYLPDGGGVFISRWHNGSPAHRYGLYALYFLTEVNGAATPDLATFIGVVRRLVRGARRPPAPARRAPARGRRPAAARPVVQRPCRPWLPVPCNTERP
jgi:hypothetical protein